MKILLAIDGSECSDEAVGEVANRPWSANTEIKVFSVAKLMIPNTPDPFLVVAAKYRELLDAQHKRAQAAIEKATAVLREGTGTKELPITTRVREGNPKAVILDEAEEWSADLIVMGSHGHSALGRFLMGSVSHAVMSHAPCSVEIVRHKTD
jgi:nucleotide-binding universal stress UspA family protein